MKPIRSESLATCHCKLYPFISTNTLIFQIINVILIVKNHNEIHKSSFAVHRDYRSGGCIRVQLKMNRVCVERERERIVFMEYTEDKLMRHKTMSQFSGGPNMNLRIMSN